VAADIPLSVADVFAYACVNCHSENTRWPWYSYIAPASWIVETDVKRAHERFNLSRWDGLDAAEQRRFDAIATVIENRELPLHRFVVVHPGVKLTTLDSVQVIEWALSVAASVHPPHGQRGKAGLPPPGLLGLFVSCQFAGFAVRPLAESISLLLR
jgi:hypothetical protein